MDQPELQTWLRANPDTWRFAWTAADDYLLARAGMKLGLWASFPVGCQAIEKLLKSFILAAESTISDQKELKRHLQSLADANGRPAHGHDLVTALSLAEAAGFSAGDCIRNDVERWGKMYALRYPDQGGPRSLSTAEIDSLDSVLLTIWDAFRGVNHAFFLTSGPMRFAYAHRLQPGNDQSWTVFVDANRAWSAREQQVLREIDAYRAEGAEGGAGRGG